MDRNPVRQRLIEMYCATGDITFLSLACMHYLGYFTDEEALAFGQKRLEANILGVLSYKLATASPIRFRDRLQRERTQRNKNHLRLALANQFGFNRPDSRVGRFRTTVQQLAAERRRRAYQRAGLLPSTDDGDATTS
jgi:hypothetical protein